MKAKSTPPVFIERNIPIPSLLNGESNRGRPHKYPFRDMKLGDSFFVPNRTTAQFSTNSSNFQKKNPEFLFTHRAAIKAGVKGVRVWRVKVVKKVGKVAKK